MKEKGGVGGGKGNERWARVGGGGVRVEGEEEWGGEKTEEGGGWSK